MRSMCRSLWSCLGGGGHLNIAGAQLDGVTLEEAKDKLKSTIRTMIEEGAI